MGVCRRDEIVCGCVGGLVGIVISEGQVQCCPFVERMWMLYFFSMGWGRGVVCLQPPHVGHASRIRVPWPQALVHGVSGGRSFLFFGCGMQSADFPRQMPPHGYLAV
jgi:hypothetical protein